MEGEDCGQWADKKTDGQASQIFPNTLYLSHTPLMSARGARVVLPRTSAALCCPLWARVLGLPSAPGKPALINHCGSSYPFPCLPGTTPAVLLGLFLRGSHAPVSVSLLPGLARGSAKLG